MRELNERYAAIAKERMTQTLKSGVLAQKYMRTSTAYFHGKPMESLYLPKLFPFKAVDVLSRAVETLYGILCKVMQRYLNDAEYRKLFGFTSELERLILTPAGYSQMLPLTRIDVFLNEEDLTFKFCEFNADGSSAMNEDREIGIATKGTDTYKIFSQDCQLKPFELFDSWVRAFKDIYGEYSAGEKEGFRVVIADFMERATRSEFYVFRDAFQRAGIECEVCEIRELKFTDGRMVTPDGQKVDAIYRRAVTTDILEKLDEVGPLLEAVQENAVCLIGHFRTQIIHNKVIFEVLHRPETLGMLNEGERQFVLEHVPVTCLLNKGNFNFDEVVENREKWLIKPVDQYAGRNVHAGIDMDSLQWRNLLKNCMGKGYILQEFCTPYKTENLDFTDTERPEFKTYNNTTGLYVYNGKLQGMLSRAGLENTISDYTASRTMASFLATGR